MLLTAMEKRGPPYKLWWLYFTSYDSYRLMTSAFSDRLMASGGGGGGGGGGCSTPSPEISGTTRGMTMKFLPDVVIHKEARNQKKNLT